MVPSNQAICSIHAAESNTFFSPTTQLALSAQDPELTSLVVWAEIRTIVTLLAQFDGMMQLTLQELTVVMVCADNEGPGNKQLAHLIFQRPVIQCTQFMTEDTKRTQDGSTMSIVPLSQSSHLQQTHCIILALGKP